MGDNTLHTNMKSTIKEFKAEAQKPKYPYLAKYKSKQFMVPTFTVLFSNKDSGVVVYSEDKDYPIGLLRNDWIEKSFVPVPDGTQITLEQ